MSNTIEIRKLKLEDAVDGEKLVHKYVDDLAGAFPFKIGCKTIFDVALSSISHVLIVDGKMCGILSGNITQSLVGGEKIFNTLLWYVDPDYKKHGLKLLRHVEGLLKERGYNKMVFSHSTGKNCDRMAKLYKAIGFEPFEIQYIKEF